MGKKSYMNEVQLPKEVVVTGNIAHIPSSKKVKYINSQSFQKESDLERLVKKGLHDFEWFKRFLQNTSMPIILEYAEEQILKTKTFDKKQKEELLRIIENHEIRQLNK